MLCCIQSISSKFNTSFLVVVIPKGQNAYFLNWRNYNHIESVVNAVRIYTVFISTISTIIILSIECERWNLDI